MATWIAHLRIAEKLLEKAKYLDKKSFVTGTIAPDAGVPNEDWSRFSPLPEVTHWRNSKGEIEAESFYDKYVSCMQFEEETDTFSFMLGYYTHLLSDIEWGKLYKRKKEEPHYKENLEKDPGFIWRIKEDWYGLDYEYLSQNEQSIFFSCFKNIIEVKDYLDYFPQGAFTNRFKYIREMYLENYKNPQREFIYLSKVEMDGFVEDAAVNIEKMLYEKSESCYRIK